MVKLQKSTFRAYKSIWTRLLCFVYRTSQPSHNVPLLHRFTNAQLFYLDRVMRLAKELSSLQRLLGCPGSPAEGVEEVVCNLDRACLQLCIALLDHTL
jgi:hypothetical protein